MRCLIDFLHGRLLGICMASLLLTGALGAATLCQAADGWREFELPVKLTVGYAVRVLDMNRDQRPDILIVDSKRLLWLENPSWKEHVIYATPDAKADNVCCAPHDVDGDGLIDIALGADWQPNNTDSGGSIGWLKQQPAGQWTYQALAQEPTTHRMHWVELAPGKPSLVVAPLKGPGSRAPGFDQVGVRLVALTPSATGQAPWALHVLSDKLHVMHNFHITDLDRNGRPDLVCASYEGASWLRFDAQGNLASTQSLGSGQEGTAPARGSSEIRDGQLAGQRPYLATIEPWHGDKVVVYVAPPGWQPATSTAPWQRQVIDDQLAWGHAVAIANLDSDAEQELVIGVRDNQSNDHRCGVRIYDPTPDGQAWKRSLVDPGGVAVEDLVTADLDADGKLEIIAVGRATHNAKIYYAQ